MEQYRDNVAKLKERLLDCNLTDKYCFVVHAVGLGKVNIDVLNGHLKKVEEREGETDFQIISLIRLLFLSINTHETECARIITSLSKFPFWPINEDLHKDVDKIVFWSENHILMMLSSCYLFKQFAYTELKRNHDVRKPDSSSSNPDVPDYENHLETELLRAYLQAHCATGFSGVYEVNSHVYLPYSLSALFNIYDFSLDNTMKEHANRMINNIIRHVLKCTPSLTGVANLSASARAFPRTRLRNWGHNINQLINLFNNNVSGDEPGPSAITDFLVTTTWEPSQELFDALMNDQDERQLSMNHDVDIIRDLYGHIKDSEVTPFYWSAGLVLHPAFTKDTKKYQNLKKMGHNKHLWPLSYIPGNLIKPIADNLDLFTKGQVYCGIRLNIFKRSSYGLCLSSLEWFNPHVSGFQQLPWIANICGVGVWTQSGCDSRIAGFSITNTHNPCCKQRGSLLLVSYVPPSDFNFLTVVSQLFDYKVKLFWPPDSVIDEQRVVNVNCYDATSPLVVEEGAHATASVSAGQSSSDNASSSSSAVKDSAAIHVTEEDTELADQRKQYIDRPRGDSESSEEEPRVIIEEIELKSLPPVPQSMEVEYEPPLALVAESEPTKKEKRPSVKKRPSWFEKSFNRAMKAVDEAIHPQEPSRKDKKQPHISSAIYREHNTWGVLRKKDCYIGVLCTQPTKMEKLSHKHGIHQPTRNKADDVPFFGRQCDAKRHSWVVVVATTAQYPTIDEFITHRLFKIKVKETGQKSESDEPYFVEVSDPLEGEVNYLCSRQG